MRVRGIRPRSPGRRTLRDFALRRLASGIKMYGRVGPRDHDEPPRRAHGSRRVVAIEMSAARFRGQAPVVAWWDGWHERSASRQHRARTISGLSAIRCRCMEGDPVRAGAALAAGHTARTAHRGPRTPSPTDRSTAAGDPRLRSGQGHEVQRDCLFLSVWRPTVVTPGCRCR